MNRFRRIASWLLLILLSAYCLHANAQGSVAWSDPPSLIRPGKAVRLSFSVAAAGNTDILLKNSSGKAAGIITEGFSAKTGRNNLQWDGMISGTPVVPGDYTLELRHAQETASTPVTIGEPSPQLSNVSADSSLIPGNTWTLQAEINMEGTITLGLTAAAREAVIYQGEHVPGKVSIAWNGYVSEKLLAPGSYVLVLRLTDQSGFPSSEELIHVKVTEQNGTASTPAPTTAPLDTSFAPSASTATLTPVPTGTSFAVSTPSVASDENAKSPSDFSDYPCEHPVCFWNLPMGVLDEAAIWNAMMQPVTVVKGEQRQVVKLYSQPDATSEPVGEVTCDSQGLHVLKNLDNGWSLVEAYSSSIHSSKVKVWAKFVTGYIETDKLETKEPNEKYGLLLDKLTQRMYVFQEGKIITELLISTGLQNDKQPYNETPAGEFLIVSWTGGFWSGNMFCDMALRVNGGILIHEVPCFINDENVRSYEIFERRLGEKASHGCIRVQQEKSAEGINMRWLWDNLKLNTRVFIWDDVGRSIPVPAEDTPLYYNPDGGKYYHSDERCASVRDKYLPLTPFTYGQLNETPFDKLKPCPACSPAKRPEEIELLNAGNRPEL